MMVSRVQRRYARHLAGIAASRSDPAARHVCSSIYDGVCGRPCCMRPRESAPGCKATVSAAEAKLPLLLPATMRSPLISAHDLRLNDSPTLWYANTVSNHVHRPEMAMCASTKVTSWLVVLVRMWLLSYLLLFRAHLVLLVSCSMSRNHRQDICGTHAPTHTHTAFWFELYKMCLAKKYQEMPSLSPPPCTAAQHCLWHLISVCMRACTGTAA